MTNFVYGLFIGLFCNVYSNDVIFMVDSSKSIFGSESCEYSHLIQNFTSDFVSNLDLCGDINYMSVQYSSNGYIDFPFSSNNSDVYHKMKHYDFRYGAPTLIHKGLEKVTESYDTTINSTEPTYVVLITDGETLNKADFQTALTQHPFNSTNFNIILIKIGDHILDNTIVLDVFNNSVIYLLTCDINPLEHILNNTNICSTTTSTTETETSTSTTETSTSTTETETTNNETETTTNNETETSTSTTETETTTNNETETETSTTETETETNNETETTTPKTTNDMTNSRTNSSIPPINSTNSTISCGNNSNPNYNSHVISIIYKILVYVTAGIIFLFSVVACVCLCLNNTDKKINPKPSIDIELPQRLHINATPIFGRSLRNEIYNSVNVNCNSDEYIEVADSLDDGDNVSHSYNYLKANNSTRSTDF
mgnify:CR=1 FL=1